MATITHKVVRGDTLWALSRKYGTTVDAIAKLNNIKNPNLIYVGQVLTISKKQASTSTTPSGSSGGNSSSTTAPTVATITHFGLQADTDRTVFAVWDWSRSNTDKYTAKWWYDTGNGVWFVGSDSEVEDKQSIYNAPTNAIRVKFQVKPISKTYKSNDKDIHYWTANWSSSKTYSFDSNPPLVPPTPTVTVEEYKLLAKLSNLDVNTNEIQFEVVRNDSSVYRSGIASIVTNAASFSCNINIGDQYKVRCRSKKGNIYSDWSAYSENSKTKPGVSSGISKCAAASETSVSLVWAAAKSATTYDIEYATKAEYLGASNASTTISSIVGTAYTVTGLTSGETYHFRVRAVNEQGQSAWTGIKSVTIGTKPQAPTTWSSTTTAICGEMITLYWVHNSEDNSKESSAQIEIVANGQTTTKTVNIPSTDTETTHSFMLDTTSYPDSTVIKWRIRTKGAIDEWGDWSSHRTIEVFAPPTLSLTMTDVNAEVIETLTSFPFYISGIAGPETQTPIGYHVTIISNDSYECWDNIGNVKTVVEGEEIYSEFYDVSQELLLQLTPYSVDLENNMAYTIKCTVSMNTGLTAESSVDFTVAWNDILYAPNAEITYDPETLCTHIRPYCDMYPVLFYQVETKSVSSLYTKYYRTDTILTDISGESVDGVYTEEYDDVVYQGETADGRIIYFCVAQSETPNLVSGVTLSVYRRDYDGRFIEIGSGLTNADSSFVTDPHPPLDYARYRIVAIDDATGGVSFTDIPGHPIGEKAIVIQWDEVWIPFEATQQAQIDKPTWSGSMLKLPYNIDISDSNSPDISTIEYIGRSHPVSYYGTQLGSSATWNVEIAKSDKDTLYGLRRLAIFMGDVYVREPSGSGYWANVTVSFNQTHCELTVPVTINVTRVEGGM